jgi:hypothetical protein
MDNMYRKCFNRDTNLNAFVIRISINDVIDGVVFLNNFQK